MRIDGITKEMSLEKNSKFKDWAIDNMWMFGSQGDKREPMKLTWKSQKTVDGK